MKRNNIVSCRLLLFLSLLYLACFDSKSGTNEGDVQGDCLDGVDNDDDGYTDCYDDGCNGKQACVDFYDSGSSYYADDTTDDSATNTSTDSNCSLVVSSSDDLLIEPQLFYRFYPENATILVGDCITFKMSIYHNAIQVSEDSYNNRENIPLEGGFQVGLGETKDVTFDEPGTYYFISQTGLEWDMVGTITVQ